LFQSCPRLSRDVLAKPPEDWQFLSATFQGLVNVGRPFSNVAHLQACEKDWFEYRMVTYEDSVRKEEELEQNTLIGANEHGE